MCDTLGHTLLLQMRWCKLHSREAGGTMAPAPVRTCEGNVRDRESLSGPVSEHPDQATSEPDLSVKKQKKETRKEKCQGLGMLPFPLRAVSCFLWQSGRVFAQQD
jgi:hypothetical protein